MDSLIRETNENLKTIIENIKSNLDNSKNTLDNIQMQMDKKVEEAKKYKIQVDSAKEKIKECEDNNKALELSLKELNDKYGKMNLVSLVDAGNREIKTKINDNNREINKQKEHIADLTNKARTIKDLLINLKKDKTIKESRLENLKKIYEYYSERINEVIEYAYNNSENLNDYKKVIIEAKYDDSIKENNNFNEIENTVVFDEIANIDENKNFKDEMTFINSQIDDINEITYKEENIMDESFKDEVEEVKINEDIIDSTQVFDSILINEEDNSKEVEIKEDDSKEIEIQEPVNDVEIINTIETNIPDLFINEVSETETLIGEKEELENNLINLSIEKKELEELKNIEPNKGVEQNNIKEDIEEDVDREERINKINDLFSSIDNTKTENITLNNISPININGIEKNINSAYMDIFGKPLEEDELNKKGNTLTDIFGNPILEEVTENNEIKIEELFLTNGIDFNKFKEDEKDYLKQIYNEEKFTNILNTLKRNKINLDNIYNAFNIFGEITANELESIISKLITSGQSLEAIGLVLEKLPKVKKYNLNEAIISYGDYIKNIDITELIIKAKELYNGGNN